MKSEGSICEGSHVIVRLEMDGLKEVDMSIKRDMELGKLMQMYCNHMGLKLEVLRFTYDAKQIKKYHTPNDFSFEDGDIINVLCDQMSA